MLHRNVLRVILQILLQSPDWQDISCATIYQWWSERRCVAIRLNPSFTSAVSIIYIHTTTEGFSLLLKPLVTWTIRDVAETVPHPPLLPAATTTGA